jgi:hypothetical protein
LRSFYSGSKRYSAQARQITPVYAILNRSRSEISKKQWCYSETLGDKSETGFLVGGIF